MSNSSAISVGEVDQPRREHFIPICKDDLVSLLTRQEGLTPPQRDGLQRLLQRLQEAFQLESNRRLDELKRSYSSFDPDADTEPLHPLTAAEREGRVPELFGQFAEMLERANFRRLRREDLEASIGTCSDWGLRLDVDFDVFDRLDVYVRGDRRVLRKRRRWQNWYREEEVEVPTYQRLALIFRPTAHERLKHHRNVDAVYLKLFKNIPQVDLEMLLPGTRVRMSRLDQGRILLPTISGGIITIVKIVKGAMALAFAGVYGLLGFLGLLGGTIGYGLKSFFGYLRTKDKYQLNLTQSLYYQNLDNNAGVLHRLLDEAEEQEFREAALAWFLLWREEGPLTQQALDRRAEAFLRATLGVDVDFEVDDALAKLERLDLIAGAPPAELRAIPLQEAIRRLESTWQHLGETPSLAPARAA